MPSSSYRPGASAPCTAIFSPSCTKESPRSRYSASYTPCGRLSRRFLPVNATGRPDRLQSGIKNRSVEPIRYSPPALPPTQGGPEMPRIVTECSPASICAPRRRIPSIVARISSEYAIFSSLLTPSPRKRIQSSGVPGSWTAGFVPCGLRQDAGWIFTFITPVRSFSISRPMTWAILRPFQSAP